MGLSAIVEPNKVRLPWSLRSKLEVWPLQLIGENGLGLPYIQGRISNHSSRSLRLRILVRVFNEQRQLIFTGSPGILETFDLDPQQQRSFPRQPARRWHPPPVRPQTHVGHALADRDQHRNLAPNTFHNV